MYVCICIYKFSCPKTKIGQFTKRQSMFITALLLVQPKGKCYLEPPSVGFESADLRLTLGN